MGNRISRQGLKRHPLPHIPIFFGYRIFLWQRYSGKPARRGRPKKKLNTAYKCLNLQGIFHLKGAFLYHLFMKEKVAVFWFRRDLRLEDNAGLYWALQQGIPVLPIFIFDPQILDDLDDKCDRRVDYIHQALESMNTTLSAYGSGILSFIGDPLTIFKKLSTDYCVEHVFANEDYEPAARARDKKVAAFLTENEMQWHAYKDQVIFAKDEVVKSDGKPYSIYTPFANLWRKQLTKDHYRGFPIRLSVDCLYQKTQTLPTLNSLGFEKTACVFIPLEVTDFEVSHYEEVRNYPILDQTTHSGLALRFGTISIRACVEHALACNETWLKQLIWRDFFMQILYHFPHVQTQCFKPAYEAIQWRNNEAEFERWCSGNTGYPIVDAGMRSLNATGFMHNRVRMIVASFLTKHLLIDWRWGEAYFAQKLDDYDLAANNGNWQWAAGCGCDAAPYFRVFSPAEQTKKFDATHEFCRKWIPELNELTYPTPMVEHAFARVRALKTYKEALVKS